MNENTESHQIDSRDDGRRLLAVCFDRWPLTPELVLRRMIGAGAIRMNGEAAGTKVLVRKGDHIEADGAVAAKDFPDARGLDAEIVYADHEMLAANKTFGATVVRERWDLTCPFMDGVLRWMRQNPAAPPATPGFRPRPVHRLDRDTTGVVLIALTPKAEKALCRQFRDRTIEKEYIALVAGSPPEATGEVDEPIEDNPVDKTRMRIARKNGKPSRTEFEVVERFRGYSLVRCRPKTGRRHQLRVHLAHIGYPVLGDALYGGGEGLLLSSFKRGYKAKQGREEKPIIDRCALHAAAIAFEHPSGRAMRLEAPPPRDMALALEKLRKWGRA